MQDSWKEYKIGDVAEIVGGGTPSTKEEDNFGGTIPWLTPKDLSGYPYRYIAHGERNITEKGLSNSSAKLLPAKSVLLTTRAPVGYVAIAKNPVTTNQGFRSLALKEDFDPEFVYYLLKANTAYLQNHASGTTFGELSGSTLKSLKFLFPPLPEQKTIASILGALDDKIELNRKMNETLEAMARAIFKSWFVDFDPIPGYDPHKEWQDSPLGKIPKGWKVGTLRDLCLRVENGGTPRRDEMKYWEPASIPWLTSGEVRQNIVIDTENKISEEGLANSSAKLWPQGITVVALYGATAGQVCLIAREMCANQACCGLIPRENAECYLYIAASLSVNAFERQARGSAQQNLSQQIVADFPIMIPPDSILDKFNNYAKDFFRKWIGNLKEARTLAAIRDTLLPKLLSGEVRVNI